MDTAISQTNSPFINMVEKLDRQNTLKGDELHYEVLKFVLKNQKTSKGTIEVGTSLDANGVQRPVYINVDKPKIFPEIMRNHLLRALKNFNSLLLPSEKHTVNFAMMAKDISDEELIVLAKDLLDRIKEI